MADEEKQSVVDQTDAETQQSSAEKGGAQGDDLDSLLAQWEEGSQAKDSKESDKGAQLDDTDDPKQQITEIRQYLQKQEEERTREEVNRSVDETAGLMQEEVSEQVNLPKEKWRAILQGYASEDQRILNAWNARRSDPKAWEKMAKFIAKDFVKGINSGVDQSATEDRDAVASAVASASKTPSADDGPSQEDLNNMSDAEFNKLTRSMR